MFKNFFLNIYKNKEIASNYLISKIFYVKYIKAFPYVYKYLYNNIVIKFTKSGNIAKFTSIALVYAI